MLNMPPATFPLPKEGASGEEVLKSLGAHFKWHDEVTKALVTSSIESMDEFRYFFDDEAKIEPWVSKLNLGDQKQIQAARLRRAWASVRLFYQQSEQDRSQVPVADLDTILPESELRDAKVLFWRRYKMRFPAEVHPADSTVSRVAREMEKRMLCVFNLLWKVKSLQFQLHCTQKKRKLGDGLYTDEVDDEEPATRDVETYLDRLYTLMLAYSIAGSSPIPGAPAVAEGSNLGADSTRFVAVPLDVMMAYLLRAKKTVMQVPASKRLHWLQTRDAEERSEWVSRFREGTSTLGQIVKAVFSARDAHWIPMTSGMLSEGPLPLAQPGVSPTGQDQPSKFVLGKPVNGRKVARCMKDGTKLCAAYQQAQCKSKGHCTNGAHRCGVVLRGERVCGAPSHGASTCRQPSKP